MKTLGWVLLLAAAFCISCEKRELSDAEIRERLVGTWLPDAKLARSLSGEVTYNKDSTFAGFINIQRPDLTTLNWQFAGTWNIERGTLALKYTKSNVPGLLRVGKVTADRIKSITDKELTFVTEQGNKETRRRKASQGD